MYYPGHGGFSGGNTLTSCLSDVNSGPTSSGTNSRFLFMTCILWPVAKNLKGERGIMDGP